MGNRYKRNYASDLVNIDQANEDFDDNSIKKLFDIRKEHETQYSQLIQNMALMNNNYQIQLEKKKNKMALSELDNLYRQMESLHEKLQDEVEQGIISAAEMQRRENQALDQELRRISNDRIVDAYEEQLKYNNFALINEKKNALLLNAKKEELDAEYRRKNLANQLTAINQEYKERKRIKDKQDKEEKKSKVKKLKEDFKEWKKYQSEMHAETTAALSQTNDYDERRKIKEQAAEAGDIQARLALNIEDSLNSLVSGFKTMFESTMSTYGEYQTKINTRLQGSGKSWNGIAGIGGIENTLSTIIGVNPYIKTQTMMDNVVKATEAGIANNIEQRAFLQTVKEDIADTFDAFNSNLLQVIRLQQADTTAARLGLEASLTQFFNSNFGDTAYLSDAFDSVSSNLTSAIVQMGAKQGVEFEYTVQKWLGSLYNTGANSNFVSDIASALGMLGSGDISGLSSSKMQNLLVMAAGRAGLNYAQMLTEGINSSETNLLLKSMVEYLQEIAESDNKVVKSQFSEVFGLTTNDLVAIKNLGDISNIAQTTMGYADSINELYHQMNQIPGRISVANMMDNLKQNMIYSIGSNIASNPAMYALWEVTSMIEDLAHGIALPTVSVLGSSVDLNTSVTDLMRTGIVGVSTLGSIGDLIFGVNSSLIPSSMLLKLGITAGSPDYKKRERGNIRNYKQRQLALLSQSQTIGNSAGDDYYDAAMTSANDQTKSRMAEAKKESTDITLDNIHEYLLQVFDPKITDIERLVASLAGVSVEGTDWASHVYTDSKIDNLQYTASKLVISEDELRGRENNLTFIKSIDTNVARIIEILTTTGIRIQNYGLTTPGIPTT